MEPNLVKFGTSHLEFAIDWNAVYAVEHKQPYALGAWTITIHAAFPGDRVFRKKIEDASVVSAVWAFTKSKESGLELSENLAVDMKRVCHIEPVVAEESETSPNQMADIVFSLEKGTMKLTVPIDCAKGFLQRIEPKR